MGMSFAAVPPSSPIPMSEISPAFSYRTLMQTGHDSIMRTSSILSSRSTELAQLHSCWSKPGRRLRLQWLRTPRRTISGNL